MSRHRDLSVTQLILCSATASLRRIRTNPHFTILCLVRNLSALGDDLYFLALPWFVLLTTNSAFNVATVAAAQLLPPLLFGFVAGPVADRIDRRKILIGCDLMSALVVATLPILHHFGLLGLQTIYGAALILGTTSTFDSPALQASIPTLVISDDRVWANSLWATGQRVVGLLGPGLAGALIALMGSIHLLWIDAASFLVSACILVTIRIPRLPVERRHVPLRSDMLTGYRFIFRHRLYRRVLITVIVGSAAGGATAALLLYFLRDSFGLNSQGAGLVLSLSSFGGIVGSLLTPRLYQRLGAWSALLVGTGATGLGIIVLGGSPLVIFVIPALVFIDAAIALAAISAITIRQEQVPNELLGRVSAAARLLSRSSGPVAMLIAGVAAQVIGVRVVLLSAGTLLLLSAGILSLIPREQSFQAELT
ncbi:MAG: MFS transporter [Chloroflexi bacterium]|nr:MFS transporter [Chloroflexota bacterium]